MINMDINKIIKILNEKGSVIAIKTDTVYGLVCNANDIDAVNNIYKLKKRESIKPLSLFVDDIKKLNDIINISLLSNKCKSIIKKYWPGGLTIILNTINDKYNYLTAGKDNIGVRVPNDKLLLDILSKIDFPLAQTSCNISGESEYKNANEIIDKFGNNIDLIVDGGNVVNNVPSTVIKFENDNVVVLRKGAVLISEQ